MNQIKCEICGGNDLVKKESVFLCRNCLAKYSIEEAKKMFIKADDQFHLPNIVNDGNQAPNNTDDNHGNSENSNQIVNLRILAQDALKQQDIERALHCYELILAEQANDWQAVYYTSYLNFLKPGLTQKNMQERFDSLREGVDKSIKLFVETQDFKVNLFSNDNFNNFNSLINNIFDICEKYKDRKAMFNIYEIKHSIALLYDLLGDCFDDCCNDNIKALYCWKTAYELDKNIIYVLKAKKYDPYLYEKLSQLSVIVSVVLSAIILIGIVWLFFVTKDSIWNFLNNVYINTLYKFYNVLVN